MRPIYDGRSARPGILENNEKRQLNEEGRKKGGKRNRVRL